MNVTRESYLRITLFSFIVTAIVLSLAYVLISFPLDIALILALLILGTVIVLFGLTLFIRRRPRHTVYADLARIDAMDGPAFEHFVARLLQERGFHARVTGAPGDLGVDILAEKQGLRYAIQVKRQAGLVSRRSVSDAVAGKIHYGCNVAMVITNSFFSPGAIELARSTGCELVNREMLAIWIQEAKS